ncbi:hypothetical protein PUNSTDRAFT_122880 [Punctularia strigosozonata HHB-11173 SS5]|uniref:Uncharacterized protein n=1 Tax=Punctularia strigosozonata (strain HHB-11173) TaxID=741275 RepID=R7S3C9_PUNST|nr:uncharacterized protein PUNSTDRAFT_122880 [Punctularia strigosozonata HHB-11173 SS5]EIN04292.1 hypothetical protein PUNSTDRAFT_122880 [Punctularia strigosozonata HHB-11173 SS5]
MAPYVTGYLLRSTYGGRDDVFAYSDPVVQPWPVPHFASLPFDILEDIAAFFVPADASKPPDAADLAALRSLSETCMGFRTTFQPKVFRYIAVETQEQVEKVYEVLNGSILLAFRPMPEDADELTRKLYAVKNVVPIADVMPVSYERKFLRNGVRTLVARPYSRCSSEYLDLRFLLQMMPLLRHLVIDDFGGEQCQHILDNSARILRRWHNLESFCYSGGDLSEKTDRLPFPRAVANMTRLRHLMLEDLDIGMNPWIFTEDVGVGMDPTSEDRQRLGHAWQYVWYRPQLLMEETPSSPWLPSTLEVLELSRVNFEEKGIWLTEQVANILKKEKDAKCDDGSRVDADAAGKDWPVEFHPFARLVMCSRENLRELELSAIKGVPHEPVIHAMKAVGSGLRALHVRTYPHSLKDIVLCCPHLVSLTIDGNGMTPEDETEMLDHHIPASVRELTIYAPWHFEDFGQWLESESSSVNTGLLSSLKTISLVGGLENERNVPWETTCAIVEATERRNNVHPESEAVNVVLVRGFATEAGSEHDSNEGGEDDEGEEGNEGSQEAPMASDSGDESDQDTENVDGDEIAEGNRASD